MWELAFKIVIAFFVVIFVLWIIAAMIGLVGGAILQTIAAIPWWLSVGAVLVIVFAVLDYNARVSLAVFLGISIFVVGGFSLIARSKNPRCVRFLQWINNGKSSWS